MARINQNRKKPYTKMTAKEQDEKEDYTPNNKLVSLLSMELNRIRETQAGRELSEAEKRRNNTMDRKKVYYLNNHIFQAMADLVFFFEAIATHPELEDLYEDDIKDLLGIRRKSPSSSNESEPKPLCGFMFHKLLSNILKVSDSPFERRENVKDFRLILNHRAEEIVRMKMR